MLAVVHAINHSDQPLVANQNGQRQTAVVGQKQHCKSCGQAQYNQQFWFCVAIHQPISIEFAPCSMPSLNPSLSRSGFLTKNWLFTTLPSRL
ncbi:hypothetical protein, partial [Herpetosiphon sp.]|uniref:hypothetical protein n=1 Tax=Herpetosiphon sp. TaxID=71864 RepID=UPI00257F7AFE